MSNLKKYNKISFFNNKKIIDLVTLSTSFGAQCKKITLEDKSQIIVKELTDSEVNYNSIYYEGKSLKFMNKRLPRLFPKVLYLKKNFLIMEYINHNNFRNAQSEQDLAYQISKIHQIKNNQFGFKFDPPIGGLQQPSNFEKSWVDFYGNKRLAMIFELINKSNPMPTEINKGIENIIKNLKNLIPNSPQPSLIHGDLWEGNILYHNGKIVGLIDPGIYYAHHEMELAYLEFFKHISKDFFKYYSEYNYIDKDYFKYSECYQLYYCLLNVHLWSRDYINHTAELVRQFR